MTGVLLKGKEIAVAIREDLERRAAKALKNRSLKLATIRIGDAEDAKLYFQSIQKLMDKFKIPITTTELSTTATFDECNRKIEALAHDPSITGILLLSPIPKGLDYESLLQMIPVQRDAEGTRYAVSINGNYAEIYPPTALAAFEMVQASKQGIAGKDAVVVGRSRIVGRPVADLLIRNHATVTVCHTKTRDLQSHISRADIVIAAAGRPRMIPGAWIKKGAVVVDAGESIVDGKPVGDIDFESAAERAGFISPVPGGVGPLTSLMLVRNILNLSAAQASSTHTPSHESPS